MLVGKGIQSGAAICFSLLVSGLVTGCQNAAPAMDRAEATSPQSQPSPPLRQPLGVMSSLPVAWPVLADFAHIARGEAQMPWLGQQLSDRFNIIALDNLVAVASPKIGEAPRDPLSRVSAIAVIQPRGLSPLDNVALDNWVRAGGSLLLALDPNLTGHYDIAITDPRHPSVIALIPPVVQRWGLEITFDEDQGEELVFAALGDQPLALHIHGKIVPIDGAQNNCEVDATGALAQCKVGAGQVTLLADAAVFEHQELAGDRGEAVHALLDYAFGQSGA